MTNKLLDCCRVNWKTILVILTPVLLTPLIVPFSERSQESKCGFLILVITLYWVTEVFPLPVTSLLPIALAPLLGVTSSSRLCRVFLEDISFLLIGGTIVAIAIEETKLHKRIALRILLFIGVEPRRLLLGVMVTTAFLSMWISNMATTAMMLPITRALLAKLLDATSEVNDDQTQRCEETNITLEMTSTTENGITSVESLQSTTLRRKSNMADENLEASTMAQDHSLHKPEVDSAIRKLHHLDDRSLAVLKTFNLSVCYSANIGGMATLTGTPPNMVMSRMVRDMYKESPVTFANWFLFGCPTTLILLSGAYIWMNITGFGFRSTITCTTPVSPAKIKKTKLAVKEELHQLGEIKFNEVVVLVHFILLVSLWLFRAPGSFPGWSAFFKPGYVSDASVAVLIACSLFVFPNARPNVLFFRSKADSSPSRSTSSILSWKKTMKQFPWGVIFLCGGGFALSEAIKVSGLSKLIVHNLMFIKVLPVWVACLLIILLTSSVTEIMSNTVITMLILPMLKELAVELQVHPLYLMLPATAASSLAFMLPIATPPNALVYAYGDLRVSDMMKSGFILNTFGVMVILLAINTWGYYVFTMGTVPNWALSASIASINKTVFSANITNFANSPISF